MLVTIVCHFEEGLRPNVVNKYGLYSLLGVIIYNLIDYISICTDAELFISFCRIFNIFPAKLFSMNDPMCLQQSTRRRINLLLDSLSTNIHTCAFHLGNALLSKTRFSTHIKFLSTCLREKLVPNGFQIRKSVNVKCRNLNAVVIRLSNGPVTYCESLSNQTAIGLISTTSQ